MEDHRRNRGGKGAPHWSQQPWGPQFGPPQPPPQGPPPQPPPPPPQGPPPQPPPQGPPPQPPPQGPPPHPFVLDAPKRKGPDPRPPTLPLSDTCIRLWLQWARLSTRTHRTARCSREITRLVIDCPASLYLLSFCVTAQSVVA